MLGEAATGQSGDIWVGHYDAPLDEREIARHYTLTSNNLEIVRHIAAVPPGLTSWVVRPATISRTSIWNICYATSRFSIWPSGNYQRACPSSEHLAQLAA